jgi:hypothetical protein
MNSQMAWLLAVILGAIFATNANAQTVIDKLRGWLTIEDGSKERLDCYDGIVPPDPKPKPPVAKVVADCKFLKDEDERLGSLQGRFAGKAKGPPLRTTLVVVVVWLSDDARSAVGLLIYLNGPFWFLVEPSGHDLA